MNDTTANTRDLWQHLDSTRAPRRTRATVRKAARKAARRARRITRGGGQ